MTKDMDLLTEYVRQSLSRQISKQFAQQGEPLYVVTLSGMVEKMIADGVQQTEHGNFVSIDPDQSQKIIEAAAQEADRLSQMGQPPVILCSPAVRMYVRQLLERYLPQVPILSYNELEANVEVQSVGVVNPS